MSKEVSSRLSITLNGEDKDLMISFAAQQKILNVIGGISTLDNLFIDPNIQTQAVAIVILGKDSKKLKTIQDAYTALEDYPAEELSEVLSWVIDYFTNFTMAQTQKMTEALVKVQKQAEKINPK